MHLKKFALSFGIMSTVLGGEYGLNSYNFVHPVSSKRLETRYRQNLETHFTDRSDGKIQYSDSNLSFYYTYFLNKNNGICTQLCYDSFYLHWNENLDFQHKYFHYLTGSIGYVTTDFENWRWIASISLANDLKSNQWFENFVNYGLIWGRYQAGNTVGLHIGFIRVYSALIGKPFHSQNLPILGLDWKLHPQWCVAAIYPCALSLTYNPSQDWSITAGASSFGGPLGFPRIVLTSDTQILEAYHFTLITKGFDLNVAYNFNPLSNLSIGIGYNKGGWIGTLLDEDSRFNIDPAVYIQGSLNLSF